MRQPEEVSLWPDATHDSYLLQCSSATDPTDPTSSFYSLHLRGNAVVGNWVYYLGSRIWYENSRILHLREAHFDHSPDLLAFSVIVYLVVRSNVYKVPIPGLLRTIAQDATYYFLIIFTSHLVLEMFLVFASVRISSQRSIISLRLAYTFVGWNQTTPWQVGETRICFLRLFTGFFSVR